MKELFCLVNTGRAWQQWCGHSGLLGVFSIGLGLAEVFAPGELARTYNMDGKKTLIMSSEARKLAAGVGILKRLGSSDEKLARWLQARVAGDALDLTSFAAWNGAGERVESINAALAAVVGITLLDLLCAVNQSKG